MTKIMETKQLILTRFYESLVPLYAICRSVGLFPLKAERTDSDITIESNKSDRVYFSSYVGGYFILSLYAIYSIAVDDVNYIIVAKTLVICETCIILALMFMTLVFCYMFRKVLLDCVNLLFEVDEKFPGLHIEIDYTLAKKKHLRVLTIMLCSVFIRTVIMAGSIRVDFIQQFTLFMAAFIKSLSKYEFMVFLLPVSTRFDEINNSLISYKHRKSDLNEDLYILNRLHFKLCNIARLVNAGFAFQLLASLGVSLTDILFQAFYLYVIIIRKFHLSTTLMIASPVVWLIDECLEIYLLVHACSTTAETANGTSILLHELRNSIRKNTVDTQIQMYSLQMLHQKLEFTALGFFSIDYSLLYSILGAVTTYLVIFIQFDQSQDVKDIIPEIQLPMGNCTI